MLKDKNTEIIINSLLLGSLLIMFFYHIGLFIMHRKNYSALYFAIFCLLIFIRIFIAGNHYEAYFFNLNWNTVIFLELFSFIAGIPFFTLYISSIFKKLIHKICIYIIISVSLLLILSISVLAPQVYLQQLILFEIWLLFITAYITVMLVIAIIKKMELIGVFLFGFLILATVVVNDVLTRNALIESEYLLQFGIFGFIFSQAFLLSKRFSNTYKNNEKLTKKLLKININLENIVNKRTTEVRTQKKQIENQLKELKKSFQKLRKLEIYKEGLTTMIVHDLKNPLNIILNYSDKNKLEESYNEIKKAAYSMKNMISNILYISKYENTKMIIIKKHVNLTNVIYYVLNQVKLLLKDKNIKIITEINENIHVYVDKEVLNRILINLIVNAIKFSPLNDKILINVLELKGNKIKIEIVDNGTGIKDEYQKSIFEKFGQLKNKKSGNMCSVGLGLAFCKMAIEAHGHEIAVTSKQGKGATFWFCLEKSDKKIKINSQAEYKNIEKLNILNKKEVELLKPHINKIKQIELYKISVIRNSIKKIPDISDNVIKLKQILNKALITQNKELFDKLTK